jgi:hypothetical protein
VVEDENALEFGLSGVDQALVLSDDQLCALALSADPAAPVDPDAISIGEYLGTCADPLPSWYMPTPMVRHSSGWRVPVVLGIVAAFLIIEAFGLCSTFGQLVPG